MMAATCCSIEEELVRAQKLNKVLQRCTVSARSGEKKKKINATENNSDLGEAYEQLQQSHTKLQQENTELKNELARLKKKKSAGHTDCSCEQQMESADTHHDHGMKEETLSAVQQHDPIESDHLCRALLLVFHTLSPMERCRAGGVCRQWRAVSYHQSLWQHLTLSNTILTSRDMRHLALRCIHTESINLNALIPSPAECDEDLQCYIARQRGALEPGLSILLHSSSATLRSLSITNCSLLFTDRSLWLASSLSPFLQHFHYTSEEFPPSPESIWSLANGCSQLLSLSLPPSLHSEMVERITDACLLQISQGFSALEHVCIGGPAITTSGLQALVSSSNALSHLEIVGGPPLNKDAIKLLCSGISRSLLSLTLTHNQISPQAVLLLTESCPSIQNIQLTISISDYFPSPLTTTEQHKYQRIIDNLTSLSTHPVVGTIFHLSVIS